MVSIIMDAMYLVSINSEQETGVYTSDVDFLINKFNLRENTNVACSAAKECLDFASILSSKLRANVTILQGIDNENRLRDETIGSFFEGSISFNPSSDLSQIILAFSKGVIILRNSYMRRIENEHMSQIANHSNGSVWHYKINQVPEQFIERVNSTLKNNQYGEISDGLKNAKKDSENSLKEAKSILRNYKKSIQETWDSAKSLDPLYNNIKSNLASIEKQIGVMRDRADFYKPQSHSESLVIKEFHYYNEEHWKLKIKNLSSQCFTHVQIFLYEQNKELLKIHIVEEDSVVSALVPFFKEPDVFKMHIYARSEGQICSEAFPLNPLKLDIENIRNRELVELLVKNYTNEDISGLTLVSPQLKKPLNIRDCVQAEEVFTVKVEVTTTLEKINLCIMQENLVVSNWVEASLGPVSPVQEDDFFLKVTDERLEGLRKVKKGKVSIKY